MHHINRVEFIITYACTGHCKHCSVSGAKNTNEHIHYTRLAGMLTQLKSKLPVESVMCFGGEPLLYPKEVFAILQEAKAAGIPARQLITNGFFSHNKSQIITIAQQLNQYVTDIMLSVDAFHQETIPLEPVQLFTKHSKNLKLHPAWLVSAEDDNEWNLRTREILAQFDGLPVSDGNVVFPRGNALKYFANYFPQEPPGASPYDNLPSLSILPNGDVMLNQKVLGNAYCDDILEALCTPLN